MHIREPELPALILEREPLVIQPEQVQHRRVEVMHMHWISGDIGLSTSLHFRGSEFARFE